jgi:hypothetical protein
MANDARVRQLLEQLLESGGTPDEVCRDCPELLPCVHVLEAVAGRPGRGWRPTGRAA